MSTKSKKPSKSSKAPPATPSAVAPVALPVQLLAIDSIVPAAINRPANVNIDELAASIRVMGVLQPIKVRPLADGRHEIVYGERRWRACKKLGLTEIPTHVEALTDAAAHQARVVENSQRQDLHPLEEAEAFERLLAMTDATGNAVHTPESVAAVAGRSIGHVYNRLKLTALVPEVRKAFYAGTLNTTSAFFIARDVPPSLQAQALEELLEDMHWQPGDEPLAVDEVRDFLERTYLTKLSDAPFPAKDKTLLPTAGSCEKCPKRSGNQAVLFEKSDDKDLCTDVACYREKTHAIFQRLQKEVAETGGTVLTLDASRKIFQGGAHLPWNSPWLILNAPCYEDEKRRTYEKLLGDNAPPVTLAVTSQGKPVCLVDKKAALEVLRQAGHAFAQPRKPDAPKPPPASRASTLPPAPPAHGNGDPGPAERDLDPATDELDEDEHTVDDYERRSQLPDDHPDSLARRAHTDPAAAKQDGKLRTETIRRVMAAIVAQVEKADLNDPAVLRVLLETTLGGGFYSSAQHAVKRRQLKVLKGEHMMTVLKAHTLGLDAAGLRGLLFEMLVSRDAYFSFRSEFDPQLTAAAAHFGVNISAIRTAVETEDASKQASRAAKKASKAA